MKNSEQVRDFISALLRERGQSTVFDDREDLILNGRLDSIAVIELVVFLEKNFGVQLLANQFKAEDLGTPAKIYSLVEGSK